VRLTDKPNVRNAVAWLKFSILAHCHLQNITPSDVDSARLDVHHSRGFKHRASMTARFVVNDGGFGNDVVYFEDVFSAA
jgi:hypothetical protein